MSLMRYAPEGRNSELLDRVKRLENWVSSLQNQINELKQERK